MISISPFRFEGNNVIIDPEILVYKEFKDVYELDKTTSKELALQYFIYIYHCADQKAIPILKGFNTKERHEHACRHANLQITFKPNVIILDAIEFYKTEFTSPVKELSIRLLSTLQKNIKILGKIDELVEKKLNDEGITPEGISALIDLQKSVSTIASQLPAQIKSLKEIDILISSTKENKTLRRGGEEIDESMTRNNNIEN